MQKLGNRLASDKTRLIQRTQFEPSSLEKCNGSAGRALFQFSTNSCGHSCALAIYLFPFKSLMWTEQAGLEKLELHWESKAFQRT